MFLPAKGAGGGGGDAVSAPQGPRQRKSLNADGPWNCPVLPPNLKQCFCGQGEALHSTDWGHHMGFSWKKDFRGNLSLDWLPGREGGSLPWDGCPQGPFPGAGSPMWHRPCYVSSKRFRASERFHEREPMGWPEAWIPVWPAVWPHSRAVGEEAGDRVCREKSPQPSRYNELR